MSRRWPAGTWARSWTPGSAALRCPPRSSGTRGIWGAEPGATDVDSAPARPGAHDSVRPRSAADQSLRQIGLRLVDGDALLRHRIPIADGHGLVGRGVEVDREAERRPDLVLPAVPPADLPGVVELDVPLRAQRRG